MGITDRESYIEIGTESCPSPCGDYQHNAYPNTSLRIASVPFRGLLNKKLVEEEKNGSVRPRPGITQQKVDRGRKKMIASVPVRGLIKRRINNDKKN